MNLITDKPAVLIGDRSTHGLQDSLELRWGYGISRFQKGGRLGILMKEQVDFGMLLGQSTDPGGKLCQDCCGCSGAAVTPGRGLAAAHKDIRVLQIGLPNQRSLAGKNALV